MNKYVLKIVDGQKYTAGSKAKVDISDILENNGFKTVILNIPKTKIGKILFMRRNVNKIFNSIHNGDIFVIQYPLYSRFGFKTLMKSAKKNKVKTICLIHDVESLRLYKNNKSRVKTELSIFNKFDVIISHNARMTDWLKNNGIKSKAINLNLFDYLTEAEMPKIKQDSNIVFAGNLEKSKFLNKWNFEPKLTVFGINPSDKYSNYIDYKGAKTPDELPKFLSGSYGLVWDGNSLDTNDGIYGEYTRYNNPHKVSLYLRCGLPVIVWKEAAIAEFVTKNKLGIAISDLRDLERKLNCISYEEYNDIKNNVKKISTKLSEGYFTKSAVNRAIELLDK